MSALAGPHSHSPQSPHILTLGSGATQVPGQLAKTSSHERSAQWINVSPGKRYDLIGLDGSSEKHLFR
ncbi:hypothetical protein N7453_001929 [Penicillium expansum]|nr:hypothetical protein N7453_001929 [Penicillium expansum]